VSKPEIAINRSTKCAYFQDLAFKNGIRIEKHSNIRRRRLKKLVAFYYEKSDR
jgi:hypothetical protein